VDSREQFYSYRRGISKGDFSPETAALREFSIAADLALVYTA
jgi:hypothetical protein